jgi:hypothetical protein
LNEALIEPNQSILTPETQSAGLLTTLLTTPPKSTSESTIPAPLSFTRISLCRRANPTFLAYLRVMRRFAACLEGHEHIRSYGGCDEDWEMAERKGDGK